MLETNMQRPAHLLNWSHACEKQFPFMLLHTTWDVRWIQGLSGIILTFLRGATFFFYTGQMDTHQGDPRFKRKWTNLLFGGKRASENFYHIHLV